MERTNEEYLVHDSILSSSPESDFDFHRDELVSSPSSQRYSSEDPTDDACYTYESKLLSVTNTVLLPSATKDPRLSFSQSPDTDTCLILDKTHHFFVKRAILEKRSFFFQTMFNRNWKENHLSRSGAPIHISDLPPNLFHSILHFLYTNRIVFYPSPTTIPDSFDRFEEIMELGNYLGIADEVECALSTNLKRILTTNSVFKVWKKCQKRNLEFLQTQAEKFLIKNFDLASHTNEFLLSDRELLKRVLRGGEIDTPADEILEKLKVWAQYNLWKEKMESKPCSNYCEDLLLEDMDLAIKNYLAGLLPPETLFSRELKYRILTAVRM